MQEGLTQSLELGDDGKVQPVRRFSETRVQNAIDGALASVVKDSAVLQFEKTKEGWNAAVAARINGHWSIAAAYARSDWGAAVGASVRFEW